MGSYLNLLKYVPTILAVFEAVSKLADAIKKKLEKEKNGVADSIEENKEILKQSDKLVEVGGGLLPAYIQRTVTPTELRKFKDDLIAVVLSTRTAIESFQKLLV